KMTAPQYLWLEPGRADISEGLRARVADPVWFLARQWQLGEHRGEDASTPLIVDVSASHIPITYQPGLDPTIIPAEALIEAEPGDWWTVGRRIRLGRLAAQLLTPAQCADYPLGDLPTPYDQLHDEVDGRQVFESHVLLGNPIWSDVPASLPECW